MMNTVTLPGLTSARSAENEGVQAPQIYRLRKSFAVVQFDAGAKGRIVVLEKGTELCFAGPSAMPKCFEVVCKDQRYNIFQVDLLGPWSDPAKPRRNGTMRARPVGVCA